MLFILMVYSDLGVYRRYSPSRSDAIFSLKGYFRQKCGFRTFSRTRPTTQINSEKALTSTGLRRQRENESRGALPPRHGASERLWFEAAELLHEIRALHQSNVCEVEITQDVILEPSGPFLVRAG